MNEIEILKEKAESELMSIFLKAGFEEIPREEDGWYSLDRLYEFAKQKGETRERSGFYSALVQKANMGELEKKKHGRNVYFKDVGKQD